MFSVLLPSWPTSLCWFLVFSPLVPSWVSLVGSCPSASILLSTEAGKAFLTMTSNIMASLLQSRLLLIWPYIICFRLSTRSAQWRESVCHFCTSPSLACALPASSHCGRPSAFLSSSDLILPPNTSTSPTSSTWLSLMAVLVHSPLPIVVPFLLGDWESIPRLLCIFLWLVCLVSQKNSKFMKF